MGTGKGLLITLSAAEASDSWGFVGVVRVGEIEAYRTIRSYDAPRPALEATQRLLAEALASLMAGHEWRDAPHDFGHPPRGAELELGVGAGEGVVPRPGTPPGPARRGA